MQTETRSLVDATEAKLRSIVIDGREPTFAERSELRSALQLTDDAELKRELSRVAAVYRLQSVAGTSASRGEVDKAVEVATDLLETEGPKVQKQIDQLQALLTSMERDAAMATKRQREAAEALDKLKTIVPIPIRQAYDERIREINEVIREDLHRLKTEVAHAERILRVDVNDDSFHEFVRLHCPSAYVAKNGRTRVDPNVWQSFVNDATKNLADWRNELGSTQQEYAEALAEAETILEYYAR